MLAPERSASGEFCAPVACHCVLILQSGQAEISFISGHIQLRSTAFGRFIPSGLSEIAFIVLNWPRGHTQLRLSLVIDFLG